MSCRTHARGVGKATFCKFPYRIKRIPRCTDGQRGRDNSKRHETPLRHRCVRQTAATEGYCGVQGAYGKNHKRGVCTDIALQPHSEGRLSDCEQRTTTLLLQDGLYEQQLQFHAGDSRIYKNSADRIIMSALFF